MHNFTLSQVFVLLILCIFTCPAANSQVKKSEQPNGEFEFQKNTALVFSVDPRTNGVTEVYLKDPDVEQQLYKLKEDCYRCQFYHGNVEGTLKIKDKKIVNSRSSVFTINTTDNLIPGINFFPGTEYTPGAEFSLAGIRTTVVANKKGSFILEAN